MNEIHQFFAKQGLYRPDNDSLLGGVCAGIGRRIGLEPWPARILFLVLLMVVPGSQILVYPILWVLMPSEQQVALAAYGSYPPAPADQHPTV